jgi:FlaA1/EpsC-like NDP-sugar epimerase
VRAGKPVLIVGAGDAGAAVARELKNHNGHRSVPIGFVDDDPAKILLFEGAEKELTT